MANLDGIILEKMDSSCSLGAETDAESDVYKKEAEEQLQALYRKSVEIQRLQQERREEAFIVYWKMTFTRLLENYIYWKMTALSQEGILKNTETFVQGLEELKSKHHSIRNSLLQTSTVLKERNKVTNFIEEKVTIVEKSLEVIQLGIEEAQVMMALAGHLQFMETEKQKPKAQVRRLCQENAWLRDELATTQQKLQKSEQSVVQLEEEKKHLEFMNSMKKYDTDHAEIEEKQEDITEKSDLLQDLGFGLDDDDEKLQQELTEKTHMIESKSVEIAELTAKLHTAENEVTFLRQAEKESRAMLRNFQDRLENLLPITMEMNSDNDSIFRETKICPAATVVSQKGLSSPLYLSMQCSSIETCNQESTVPNSVISLPILMQKLSMEPLSENVVDAKDGENGSSATTSSPVDHPNGVSSITTSSAPLPMESLPMQMVSLEANFTVGERFRVIEQKLKHVLASQTNKNEKLITENQRWRDSVDELRCQEREKSQQKSAEIQSLQQKCNEHSIEVAKLMAKLKTAEKELLLLRQEFKDSQAMFCNFQVCKEELSATVAKNQELKSQLKSGAAQSGKDMEAFDKITKDVESLAGECDNCKKAAENGNSKIQRLEKQLQTAEQKYKSDTESLKNKNEQLETENRRLETGEKSLRGDLRGVRWELYTLVAHSVVDNRFKVTETMLKIALELREKMLSYIDEKLDEGIVEELVNPIACKLSQSLRLGSRQITDKLTFS